VLVTREPVLRRFWYPVAFSSALAAGPVRRRLLGEDLVLWRAGEPDGAVAAAADRCPHRDARLSRGWTDGPHLVCPYHGWAFGSDGHVASVPQLDAATALAPKGRLATVAALERYGWVWVCLDDNPLGGVPELVEWGAPGWRVVPEYEWLFECSPAHLLENNLDPAHIAFVHRATFGAGTDPRVEVPEVERTAHGLVTRSTIPVAGRPGQVSDATVRIVTNEVWAPFLGVFRIDYPDGLSHVMVKACTPEDDGRTRLLQQVVRNDTERDRPAADILAFDDEVEAEDQAVLDGLPPDYPLEPTAQVHTRVDRPALELRRLYRELLAGSWVPAPS